MWTRIPVWPKQGGLRRIVSFICREGRSALQYAPFAERNRESGRTLWCTGCPGRQDPSPVRRRVTAEVYDIGKGRRFLQHPHERRTGVFCSIRRGEDREAASSCRPEEESRREVPARRNLRGGRPYRHIHHARGDTPEIHRDIVRVGVTRFHTHGGRLFPPLRKG